MTPPDSVARIRRSWWVALAGLLLGIAVGWASAPGTAGKRTIFEATHTLIVDQRQAGNAAIYRAAPLAASGPVPDRVAARLKIDPQAVRSMVSAEIPVDAAVLKVLLVTARSPEAQQAEALANLTAEELIVELGAATAPLRTLESAVASPVATDDIVGPRSGPGRAMLLGAFGLVLGVCATLVLERFENRIQRRSTAERALGLPVMAEVPALARSDPGRMLFEEQPSALVEAYRRLRTGVEQWAAQTDSADDRRIVVVLSTTGGEGATTTVAHLAAAFGEMGRSVLVISADLRDPRLHLYFDKAREPGLSEVLRGASDAQGLADLEVATAVRGVTFIASGAPVGNPAPLLEDMGALLRDSRTLADIVLVDTPPLLTSNDGADLARYADGVLLVVRAGRTSVTAAARSAEMLERLNIPVIGAALVGAGR